MTAAQAEIAAPPKRIRGNGALGPAAAVYLLVVVAAAAIVSVPFHVRPASHTDWLLFVVLTMSAGAAQLLPVQTPAFQAYYTTTVFFVAGALLLPPQLLALMIVFAHLPEWARYRYPWYIQTFNVAKWIVASLTVTFICGTAIERGDVSTDLQRLALVGAAAAGACVIVDHILLAQMLRLARGKAYRETGLFSFGSLSTEIVLAILGVGLAAVWELAPALVPFVLAPLVVVYRSLQLPSLEMAARLDSKTELFNARYFASALDGELERAKRFERPLSILLADLDLLRDVNNTCGHLAGDAVIRGVADVLRSQLRPFDIPGRFGGEEFAVALPEASHEEALVIAERIRAAVANAEFKLPSGDGFVTATISLGVATHPESETVDDLIHQADLALYRSKALGRNRVSGTAPLTVVEPPTPVAAAPAREAHNTPVASPAPKTSPGQRHVRVVELVAALAAASAILFGLLAAGAVQAIAANPWTFVAFLSLSVGLQLIGTSMYGRGTDAASAIGIIATGFVLGPGPAIIVAAAAASVQFIRRRGRPYRAVFDLADFALSAATAAAIFQALGGPDASVGLGFAIALLAGVAYKTVNVGLLCIAMSIEEDTPFREIWKE